MFKTLILGSTALAFLSLPALIVAQETTTTQAPGQARCPL